MGPTEKTMGIWHFTIFIQNNLLRTCSVEKWSSPESRKTLCLVSVNQAEPLAPSTSLTFVIICSQFYSILVTIFTLSCQISSMEVLHHAFQKSTKISLPKKHQGVNPKKARIMSRLIWIILPQSLTTSNWRVLTTVATASSVRKFGRVTIPSLGKLIISPSLIPRF